MYMPTDASVTDLERRKHVKLRVRSDLAISPQRYEGRTYYVIKDPVSLRYYRFKEQEYFLLKLMDGNHTNDQAQKELLDIVRSLRHGVQLITEPDHGALGSSTVGIPMASGAAMELKWMYFEIRRFVFA